MAGSVNKENGDTDPERIYLDGKSLTQVSEITGIAISTLRFRFHRSGILRDRTQAVRMAGNEGRLGSGMRGKRREFTDEHKAAISEARKKWSEENSSGVSLKPNGYLEYTKGPFKGKSVHVVKMEKRIGRTLLPDECVHHIDEDKTNNDENNLALVTRSGHARLHRHQDYLLNKKRERDSNGRFS